MAEAQADNTAFGSEASTSFIDSSYQILLNDSLEAYSTPHAKAYAVRAKPGAAVDAEDSNMYALVFENYFPVSRKKLRALEGIKDPHHCNILAFGNFTLATSKAVRFVVILERPRGISLADYVAQNSPVEVDLIEDLMSQMNMIISKYSQKGIVHGGINPDTVFIDTAKNQFCLKEGFSNFSGADQKPAFESLDRLLAGPFGKGAADETSDYYSLGVLLLFMMAGKAPFVEKEPSGIVDRRMELGSYEALVKELELDERLSKTRWEGLLRGMVTESIVERHVAQHITSWLKGKDIKAPIGTKHRKTPSPFEFNTKQYYNTKHLAHDLFKFWAEAKSQLKLHDLWRWMKLIVKDVDKADELDRLRQSTKEMILPDSKLSKIITILDPNGPVRYIDLSFHVVGLGTTILDSVTHNNQERIQRIAAVLSEGVMDFWVDKQIDDSEYDSSQLGWSSGTLKSFLLKTDMGFAMERCLYETNPDIPCLSPMVADHYCMGSESILITLNRLNVNFENDDPMDRHIAAFIASDLGIMEPIRIKTIQNFPHITKLYSVQTLAFLSIAQSQTCPGTLFKQLCEWLKTSLLEIKEKLHSDVIVAEFEKTLEAATKTGDLQALFKVVSAPHYIRKDSQGFLQAKKRFEAYTKDIESLKDTKNLKRIAYKRGRKVCVLIAYFVCMVAIMYMFATQGS